MVNEDSYQELLDLSVVAFEERLGQEQFDRLEKILTGSKELCRQWMLLMQFHADLRSIAGEVKAQQQALDVLSIRRAMRETAVSSFQLNLESFGDLGSSNTPPYSTTTPSVQVATQTPTIPVKFQSMLTTWSPLLVTFMIGVLSTVLCYHLTKEKTPVASEPLPAITNSDDSLPSGKFVAQLVSYTGNVWNATAKRPLENGDQLGFDETVTIQEGIATFELFSGLTLKLEGPAVVSIDPDGMPVVQYGKIIASLPWGAKNTAIKTSLGEVQLDGDDIAGIGVFGSGLNVYVFRGEVLIGARTPEEKPFLLSSGNGSRFSISSAGIRQQISSSLKKEFFVPWNSISSDLLTVSDAYVASVHKSKPVGYWRFEEVIEGQVLNEISDKHRGKLGGKARLVLQKNNHVMEFGFGAESGYLFMDEPFDELAGGDYAFELWVKPNHFHRSTIATLVKRRSHLQEVEGSAFLLETLGGWLDLSHRPHPHSFRYLHRSPPGSNLISGTSCYSSQDYKPRKWQHVVAVKQGHKMLLYVNGRVLATEVDRTNLVPGLHLVVGQLRSFEPVRPFVGQLDELAIYDHALTKKEIQSHYKQLRK